MRTNIRTHGIALRKLLNMKDLKRNTLNICTDYMYCV